jgi:hypothetical protein
MAINDSEVKQWSGITRILLINTLCKHQQPSKQVSWGQLGESITWWKGFWSFLYSCTWLLTAFVVQCSEFLTTDPEAQVRFLALPYFLRSSGSETGSTQPRQYKWGATWNSSFSVLGSENMAHCLGHVSRGKTCNNNSHYSHETGPYTR